MQRLRPQVQTLRSVEQYLGLEALYILGTNCVDNGRRGTLEKFLAAGGLRFFIFLFGWYLRCAQL